MTERLNTGSKGKKDGGVLGALEAVAEVAGKIQRAAEATEGLSKISPSKKEVLDQLEKRGKKTGKEPDKKEEKKKWAQEVVEDLKMGERPPELVLQEKIVQTFQSVISEKQPRISWLVEKGDMPQSVVVAQVVAEIAGSGLENDPNYLLAKAAQLRYTGQYTPDVKERTIYQKKLQAKINELYKERGFIGDPAKPEQKELETAINLSTSGYEAGQTTSFGPSADKKIVEDTLQTDWGKKKAEELNKRLKRQPDILHDTQELKKLQNELAKLEKVPAEAEGDLQLIIEQVKSLEVSAQKEILGLPGELKQRWDVVMSSSRQASETVREVKRSLIEEYEKSGKTPSVKLETFLDSMQLALDPRTKIGEIESIQLKKALEELLINPDTSSFMQPHRQEFARVLDSIHSQSEFYGLTEKIGEDRRLEMAGVRSKESIETYDLLTDPEAFFKKFDEVIARHNGDPKKIESFVHEFSQNVDHLNREILRGIDSDSEAYFDHLFTSLWHQPIYNNMISGLTEIENRLLDLERGGQIFKIGKQEFDYEKRIYIGKEVRLSEAIGDLRGRTTGEKEWREYTHNIYVLMQNRASLETYKEYTKHVKTQSVDALMLENPELENAIRLHMGYLRAQYGLNGWKTPLEEIYSATSKGGIPIDEYVKKNLMDTTVFNKKGEGIRLKAEEAERLTLLARGFVLGVNWEAIDAMASGGPRAGGKRFLGFFGPLNDINYNRYVLYRWSSELPVHEWLYTRITGHGSSEGWNVKSEMARAKRIMKERENKEPPRIVTDKMVDEGIPFIEDTYYLGIGGIKIREGWRLEAFEHLMVKNGDDINYKESVKNLMSADLYAANRFIEDWFGSGKINKDIRNELRGDVLQHLRNIAPQEFLLLDNDLTKHTEFSAYAADDKKRQEIIKVNVLRANKVTDYVLSQTQGDTVKTIGILTENDWKNIFPDYGDADRQRIIKDTKTFLEATRVVAQEAIDGGGIVATSWKEAAYIRSFPTHLEVKRNAKWSVLGESVVDRIAGDNHVISKAYSEFWTNIRDVIRTYNMDSGGAKNEKFNKMALEILKVFNGYNAVHGNSADSSERASSYRIGYQLGMLLDKYFAKSVSSRLPLGIGTALGKFDTFSSWSRYGVGDEVGGVLQFDEQMHRVWRDQLVKAQLIAPSHGRVSEVDDTKSIDTPFGRVGIKLRSKQLSWNGANFTAECGGRGWQVGLDVARSVWIYPPILIFLAAEKQFEEEEK